MKPFYLVLIICLLLVSACGGGDQATATPAVTTTAPPPPTQAAATATATASPPSPTDTPTAEAPPGTSATTWAYIYTGEPRVAALGALQAGDGGYLLVGASNYTHRDDSKEDVLLMKTDASGQVLWIKTYGGEAYDRGKAIVPAADGGYVILAETKSFGAGDYDILVIKVDADGDQVWSQTLGGPERERAGAIRAAADGGYVVVGSTASYGSGPEDLFLVRLGQAGQELWTQFYGGDYMEEGYAVHQTADGGFFVLGELLHREGVYPDQDPDIYLLRTDSSGREIWSQTREEAGAQGGHSLVPTSDGGYIIAGILIPEGRPDQADVLLLKVDGQGTLLWDQSLSDVEVFDYAIDIIETSQGDYVLAGMSTHGGQGGIPLIKIDPEGNLLWQRTLLEGRGNTVGMQVMEAPDGGYVIAGTTGPSVQAFDAILVKTDTEGNLASPTLTEIEVTPLSPAAPEPAGLTLDVPQGNPISLDGTLSPDEWAAARRIELSGGGELLLMHDQGYLYLGLRTPDNPLGSICLDRGDEIAVLHSFAALGTAIYQRGEGDWQRTRDFSWSCRDASNSPQAQQARNDHLQAEGWVASNGLMGTFEEMEYQIAMPDGSLRLAVAYLQAPTYRSVFSWPEQLDDGCTTLKLLTGPTPDRLPFAPETWMTLEASGTTASLPPPGPSPDLRITIVYDNTTYDERLTAEWGFAAWVEYGDHTLLFDTGGNGTTLLDNMDKLGLDPQTIEVVVLSHIHDDHTGGLSSLLRRANRPTVYVPASFPASFKRSTSALTDLVEVTGPVEIWPGVHTTGEVRGGVTEQGLVIETDQGIVLVTGCAHPGVVNMVRQARQVVDDEVALVVGGFHLGGASRSQVERIIDEFRELDVRQVCPTHCTGEESIAIFAEAYGDDYVQGGVGRTISIPGAEE